MKLGTLYCSLLLNKLVLQIIYPELEKYEDRLAIAALPSPNMTLESICDSYLHRVSNIIDHLLNPLLHRQGQRYSKRLSSGDMYFQKTKTKKPTIWQPWWTLSISGCSCYSLPFVFVILLLKNSIIILSYSQEGTIIVSTQFLIVIVLEWGVCNTIHKQSSHLVKLVKPASIYRRWLLACPLLQCYNS